MARQAEVGAAALHSKGWLKSHQWLLLRRMCQLSILGLFLLGPIAGIWLIKGNLAASMILDTVPLSDPYLMLQVFLTGHTPELAGLLGATIVLTFYLLVSGRVFCSWVCPVNIVTDIASDLQHRLGIKARSHYSRQARYWLLGMTLILAFTTGSLLWELVNPVSIVFRGLVFGLGLGWGVIAAIFLFELLLSHRGWCGHLCPVGAFYGLIGRVSLLRVIAAKREQCNDCMDCFDVCPEPQVIRPALKGEEDQRSPVIKSGMCTNCGRCIDICSKDVFRFGVGIDKKTPH
ncbi:MAG TPA: quinol dehydrogenase ferredoxin subunit NapH [Gammaproteobacteria bacterium]|nr:quinol dehydrogenase ferredoxin subunit NapH [Gammaproteobacteria bacterium]